MQTEEKDAPRSRIIAIRVRPKEFEMLWALAEDEGRSISNAVRRLMLEAMQSRAKEKQSLETKKGERVARLSILDSP